VHYTDQDIFAEELCSLGDEVLVLEPAPLRKAMIAHLSALRDAHV